MNNESTGLITRHYIDSLRRIHANENRSKGFGGKVKPLGYFIKLMKTWQPNSLLDYGCGKGAILEHLKTVYPNTVCEGYDPAVDNFQEIRKGKFECVFSIDVLEHIEPTFLSNVLNHINELAEKYIYLRIDTKPARKKLPNGTNAHLIIESEKWWTKVLADVIDGKIIYSKLDSKGKLDIAIEKT